MTMYFSIDFPPGAGLCLEMRAEPSMGAADLWMTIRCWCLHNKCYSEMLCSNHAKQAYM